MRRLLRRLRAVAGAPAPGPGSQLAAAHHDTATRLAALEGAHHDTATRVAGLESGHHEAVAGIKDLLDAHHLTSERVAELQRRHEALQQQLADVERQVGSTFAAVAVQSAQARQARRDELALDDRVRRLEGLLADGGADGVAQRLAAQEHTVQSLAESLRALREYVATMEQVQSAIRSELMYEIRYGGGAPRGGAGVDVAPEPKVLDPEKLQQRPLRLNLGSGLIPLDGYVNLDGREIEGVDVVADVRALPVDPETVDEIRAAHLVEHFPAEELRRVVLPHWYSRLVPGGRVVLVVPDAEAMAHHYVEGDYSFDEFRLALFGGQDYDGDFHYAMYSPAAMAGLLRDAGFSDVDVVASGRRNGACYEFELTAVRPESH